ncbi:molecular chaperone DjlA [Thiocapsa imhoffii]|uniref:Co-chaperone protein DjlA n=1 Tax=Thiocapsa imhoffii TaxID=382777 RepID=A0A9X0WEY8_9GAMM|nr:co-chaperone DjlA [Thiocapsa imhoffii]MBK1643454.1 molecular chaperone DjlA [Thiocapsa imhoffii]
MRWLGTAVGGTIGLVVGGPVGAVFGAALGQGVDRGWLGALRPAMTSGQRARIQTRFFETIFAVMGHVAKADGRVSEAEISLAKTVMDRMSLDPVQRRAAIDLFNQGKSPDFDLAGAIAALRKVSQGQPTLTHLFIEVQLLTAYVDGPPSPQQVRLLESIRRGLNVSTFAYRQLENLLLLQQRIRGAAGQRASAPTPKKPPLASAYATLGVEPKASDAEVKKAYRRLMSQHHPDKLVARGLPEEALRMASQKTQEIRKAYETISEARAA